MSKRFDRIDYIPHALLRMRVRKVSKRQVERCVQEPDREGPSATHPENIEAQRDTEVSTLIVWYERKGPGHIEVKSLVRRGKK